LEPERRNGGFWAKSWILLGEQLRNRVTPMLKGIGFSSVDFKWANSILAKERGKHNPLAKERGTRQKHGPAIIRGPIINQGKEQCAT